jgi:hypothetical protein
VSKARELPPAEQAWRNENDAQIRRAVALIKPKASRRDECIADLSLEIVEIAMELNDRHHAFYSETKVAKTAADSLARALRRAVEVSNNAKLDFGISHYFPRNELVTWQRRCEEEAKTPSRRDKKQQKAKTKVRVIEMAHWLMKKYGAEIFATTDGTSFVRLANLLYAWVSDLPRGNRKDWRQANLLNQCRAFLRERKKWGST